MTTGFPPPTSRPAGRRGRAAFALLRKHRSRLALGLLLVLVNRFSGLVLPVSSKYFVDEVVLQQRWDLLPMIVTIGLAAMLLEAASGFGVVRVLGVAAQRLIGEMRRGVEAHMLRLPVHLFDTTNTGVLVSRVMADADGIRNLLGTGLVQLVGSALTAALALILLFVLNWRLTLATIAVIGVYGVVMGVLFARMRPMFRERGRLVADVTTRLGESLSGIRVVRAYTAEKREELLFTRAVHRQFRMAARLLTRSSLTAMLSTATIGAIYALVLILGGAAVRDGAMTLGDLVMYLSLIALMALPVTQLSSVGTQVGEAMAGLDRLNEILNMATEDEEDGAKASLPDIRGDIVFEDVGFTYGEGAPALTGISFTARAGTTTALVGPSGSGKSTLTSLVIGFHRPRSGRILIDGHDLQTLRLREYRRRVGIVLQDNFLFDATIAENIAYGNPRASAEEIQEAARIAHCDEFIDALPAKYDTIVGERGVRLSGGQRQRVAIARAILARPRILVLDEATSSLDSEGEALVQDGLRSLRAGRTTLVIAHRLSTVRSADQVLVLEHGQIVERGTHEELLARNGRYRDLYEKQYRFESDRFINPGEDFTPDPVAGSFANVAVTPLSR